MDLDVFPDGVIVAGPDERVTYVNARVRRMARALPDEMIGMHLDAAMPFDDLNGNRWFECVRPYDGLSIRKRISEQSWWSPRGSEYLISATLVRERPAAQVSEVVVTIRNARIRNHLDRGRSDMIATYAHELRAPLTGVKGFTSTLLNKWDQFSDEQRRFMLGSVDEDADRLSRLVTELLDASRIDAGRLTLRREPIDVADVCRRAVVAHTDTVTVNTAADVPTVWGDSDRIMQVFANLVENAEQHGRGLRRVDVDGYRDAEPGVVVQVCDQGPGVSDEDHLRVFSRFWKSGSHGGSGLGMFIVRGIVEQHGGNITIDNDDDGPGAVVTVRLPSSAPLGRADH